MSIWEHQSIWRDRNWLLATEAIIDRTHSCLYCDDTPLLRLPHGNPPDSVPAPEGLANRSNWDVSKISSTILYCAGCGWWYAKYTFWGFTGDGHWSTQAGAGQLYSFSSVEHPEAIEEARKFLTNNLKSAKRTLSADVFEDTVASVFKDFGYVAKVTGRTGDGGIDIVLEKESTTIAVQVKRYRNSIKVEHIRAFAGALVLRGLTRGVFVTTSEYQHGCHTAAEAYKHRGLEIELINGDRVFSALRLQRRPNYEKCDDLFLDPYNALTTVECAICW